MHKDPHIANLFSSEEENCLRLDQMAAYMDGKLEGPEKNAIERHLINCDLCALTFESISAHSVEEIAVGAAAISETAWERSAALEKKKRRGAIFWLSAAASIALLISVGYFTMRGPSKADYDKAFSEAMRETSPPTSEDTGDQYAMDRLNNDAPADKLMESRNQQGKDSQKENGDAGLLSDNEALEDRSLKQANNLEIKGPLAAQDQAVFASPKTTVPPKSPEKYFSGGKESISTSSKQPVNSSTSLGKDAVKGGLTSQSKDRVAVSEEESMGDSDDFGDFDAPVLAEASKPKVVSPAPMQVDSKTAEKISGKAEVNSKKNAPGKSKSVTEQRDEVQATRPSAPAIGQNKTANTLSSGTIVSADSVKPRNDLNDGLVAYEEGRYRDAASNFRKSTEQSPSNLQAHLLAADSYLRISQPQAALFHIERVLAQPGNSYFAEAEWYKALAFMQMHDGKKAKKQLQIVIDRNGKYKAQAQKALEEL